MNQQQIVKSILNKSNNIFISKPKLASYIFMEEQLPYLKIEFLVDNGSINVESICISQIIESSFPLSHIQTLNDSILNDFDASELEDDWYEIQVRYKRDFQTGDYYEIVPFSYTKMLYKKIYENE